MTINTKNIYFLVVSGIASVLLILIIVGHVFSTREYIESIDIGDSVIDIVYDLQDGKYFFIKQNLLLSLINREQCVYWAQEGPNLSWGGHDDNSFYIYDKSADPVYVKIDIENVDQCICKNSFDVEVKYCSNWFW